VTSTVRRMQLRNDTDQQGNINSACRSHNEFFCILSPPLKSKFPIILKTLTQNTIPVQNFTFILNQYCEARARISQSVCLNTGWAVRGSNPGGGEIFCTRPDRS
jgi:hypothetical protein